MKETAWQVPVLFLLLSAKGNKIDMQIAHDGWPMIAFSGFMTLAGFWISPFISFFMAVLTIFLVWFFRDPERIISHDENIWVSPADGKVVEIESVFHPFTGKSVKIGIFMSPFNVHVNRIPFPGRVDYLEYVPGKKWMAFSPKASEDNERMYTGIETREGRAMMVQIAGFLARRIVCRVEKGMELNRGDRFGMIKLGSKVDLYLPVGVGLSVKPGQAVKAGVTVIGVSGK